MTGLDRDAERPTAVAAFAAVLRRDAQLPCARLAQAKANQAAAMTRHEIDRLRRHPARRHGKVEIAIAQRVAGQDNQTTVRQMLADRLQIAVAGHCHDCDDKTNLFDKES